jgi:protein gp37
MAGTKFNPKVLTPTKGLDETSTIDDAPPLHWRRPEMIFTCSLSDFFHQEADPWRSQAWEVIRRTPHHGYHILTKRISRVLSNPEKCLPPDWDSEWDKGYRHVWLGVTVESPQFYWRMDMLNRIKTTLRWVSCEPLLEPLPDLHKHGLGSTIMWCFTGGESDRYDPRPNGGVPLGWFRDIRDQCNKARIPFHFLQQGGSKPCHCGCLSKYGCRKLDGRMYQQYPVPSLIAEGPKRGKRQRERILDLLKKNNVLVYKTPVQTESTRGIPRQTDRILLTDTVNQQTLSNLQNALFDTALTLETWP